MCRENYVLSSKLEKCCEGMGGVPLPENASDAEFTQWMQWVRDDDYEHSTLERGNDFKLFNTMTRII